MSSQSLSSRLINKFRLKGIGSPTKKQQIIFNEIDSSTYTSNNPMNDQSANMQGGGNNQSILDQSAMPFGVNIS